MATFYNFTLKTEASWTKTVVKPVCKLGMLMMLLCMFGLFLNKKIKNILCRKILILNAQNLQQKT